MCPSKNRETSNNGKVNFKKHQYMHSTCNLFHTHKPFLVGHALLYLLPAPSLACSAQPKNLCQMLSHSLLKHASSTYFYQLLIAMYPVLYGPCSKTDPKNFFTCSVLCCTIPVSITEVHLSPLDSWTLERPNC